MANRVKHNMVNTRCTKCGCRPWEKSRPCITQKEAKAKQRKIERDEQETMRKDTERDLLRYADEMPDNDVRFGGGE